MKALVWAQSKNGIIGRNNSIPWWVPADLKLFRALTEGSTVVMGKNTFKSLGQPLPNRTNIIVSSTQSATDGAIVVPSLDQAFAKADGDVYVIGGHSIYVEAMESADLLYVSRLPFEILDGHVKAPEISPDFDLVDQQAHICLISNTVFVRETWAKK